MKSFKIIVGMALALLMLLSLCPLGAAEGTTGIGLGSLSLFPLSKPGNELAGQVFHFVTKDLDGNEVTSEELFSQNKITMVNYWATWCGPCVGELKELAEIHTALQASGCGIVGILDDAYEAGGINKAKSLMKKNDVQYPVVAPCEDMAPCLNTFAYLPTSFFVDQNGVIVGSIIIGAAVDEYEQAVLALLNSAEAEAQPAGRYRVIVTDREGNPVKGVAIQFCSDESCTVQKTDAEGVAAFDMPEGKPYTVHILKVPACYAKDDTEYPVPETYGDLRLTIDFAS